MWELSVLLISFTSSRPCIYELVFHIQCTWATLFFFSSFFCWADCDWVWSSVHLHGYLSDEFGVSKLLEVFRSRDKAHMPRDPRYRNTASPMWASSSHQLWSLGPEWLVSVVFVSSLPICWYCIQFHNSNIFHTCHCDNTSNVVNVIRKEVMRLLWGTSRIL